MISLSPAIPSQARQAFRWDATAGLLGGLYFGMIIPFVAVIARDKLQASAFQISMIAAAPFAGHLFALYWATQIRHHREIPFVVSIGVIAKSLFFLMLLATTAPVFVAIAAAAMMVTQFMNPAYVTVMKDIYPDEHRGRLMGLVRVGMVITIMAGASLAGWLLPSVGYRYLFPAAALIGILSSLSFGRIKTPEVAEPTRERVSIPQSLAILRNDEDFRLFILGLFVFGSGSLMTVPLIPIFQVDQLQITPGWVGLLATVSTALSGVAYYFWGRMIDRHSPFPGLLICLAVISLIKIVYAYAYSLPILLVAAVFAGIGQPGVELAWMNALMHFTDRDGIARYAALHYSIAGVRGLILPFIGTALLRVIDIRQLFLLGALINLFGLWIMYQAVKRFMGNAHSVRQ